MPLNSRDIEEIDRKPFKEPWFTGLLLASVRLLMKVPPVKKYMSESVGGLSGSIFQCWEKEDYEKATVISIKALEKYRNTKSRFVPSMDHHNWWSFMKHGVDSAKYIENKELRSKLIEHASNGIEPYEGFDVAYTYLEISRWMYHSENYEKAAKFAEKASAADATWAEPDFILGWYGLLLGRGNAEEYLSSAVEKDHRVLFRIANNDVCKQYPQILSKLKEQYQYSSEICPNKNV